MAAFGFVQNQGDAWAAMMMALDRELEATALAAGRSMEGEMSLSFAIRYVLRPVEMED